MYMEQEQIWKLRISVDLWFEVEGPSVFTQFYPHWIASGQVISTVKLMGPKLEFPGVKL